MVACEDADPVADDAEGDPLSEDADPAADDAEGDPLGDADGGGRDAALALGAAIGWASRSAGTVGFELQEMLHTSAAGSDARDHWRLMQLPTGASVARPNRDDKFYVLWRPGGPSPPRGRCPGAHPKM
jgi:hypothetical protein